MKFFTEIKILPEGTVWFTDPGQTADFADWLADMDTLLARRQRFVTVSAPMRRQISTEQRTADRKLYMEWMKANREALSAYCAAMLLIEPDAEQAAMMRAQSAKLAPAMGVDYIVEDNEADAVRHAEEILKAV